MICPICNLQLIPKYIEQDPRHIPGHTWKTLVYQCSVSSDDHKFLSHYYIEIVNDKIIFCSIINNDLWLKADQVINFTILRQFKTKKIVFQHEWIPISLDNLSNLPSIQSFTDKLIKLIPFL